MKTSCALIGPGEGPLVRTAGPGTLKVRGLPSGDEARLQLFLEGGGGSMPVRENGELQFMAANYVRVAYEGEARTFIALVETEN